MKIIRCISGDLLDVLEKVRREAMLNAILVVPCHFSREPAQSDYEVSEYLVIYESEL
jgi:hypothetical protein